MFFSQAIGHILTASRYYCKNHLLNIYFSSTDKDVGQLELVCSRKAIVCWLNLFFFLDNIKNIRLTKQGKRTFSKQANPPQCCILLHFCYFSHLLKIIDHARICRIVPRASGWHRIVMKTINPQNFHCQVKQLQCHCFKLKAIYISLSYTHWSVTSFSACGAAT